MMTEQDIDEKTREGLGDAGETPAETDADLVRAEEPGADAPLQTGEPELPAQLGAGRYVLAGFFAAGITVAFLVGKVLAGTWNRLADNVWISSHAPFLSRLAEDDRATFTTVIGGMVGIAAAVYAYRRPDVRTWTSEVATELAKVSWPAKKEVTNSTLIVIAASAFATVYLALLDRFWGFVTNLVYGS